MAERPAPSYGTPNWEMLSRWFELPPERDDAFWAVNLMKYKARADYGDGRPSPLSGKEADDAYAPLGPLAAIGAMVAFHGDVVDQPLGEPHWDRIGIVRYPSRAAFFAMQQRDDFKAQHVHKEAGMDRTIVMACQPVGVPSAVADGALVMLVERGDVASPWRSRPGVAAVVELAVEGVIVGDERAFDRVVFVRADDGARHALSSAADGLEEVHALVLAPEIDELVASITTASADQEVPS